jgi:hypothetical protein
MRAVRREPSLSIITGVVVRITLSSVVAAALFAACAKKTEPVVNARPMTAAEAAAAKVQPGDCVEARRRAAAKNDLEVDRLPVLVSGPRPFTPTPASVKADIDRNGMSFRADVVIDTLGKARVETLNVLETSNEWFPRNLKALLPRMTFSPATLAGCKVERVYKFQTSAKPKRRA